MPSPRPMMTWLDWLLTGFAGVCLFGLIAAALGAPEVDVDGTDHDEERGPAADVARRRAEARR